MISEKQLKILAYPYTSYDALICDGAVRSGKTSIMMWSFIEWAMSNFKNCRFGICGKTVKSAEKNIIVPFRTMKLTNEKYILKWKHSDNELLIEQNNVINVFEIFGGRDERSQDLIQGRTLAGVMLDEVALMPRSFVEQALSRCSVEGARFWFNCNPSTPQHWFYEDWILKAKEKNALYLHFEMTDNPSLSEDILKRYQNTYSGIFYQRFVQGLWVSAEGLIYDMFDKDKHIVHEPKTKGDIYISSDYGIQNATVFLMWQKDFINDRWVAIKEWYYSGRESMRQKTVSELADGLFSILEKDDNGDYIMPKQAIIDPSASALIEELRRRKIHVIHANNDVIKGIEDVSTLLNTNKIAFSDTCKHTIKEFGLYLWDNKATSRGEDKPIKDNDHCMDAVRYFVETKHIVNRRREEKDVYMARF